MGRHLNQFSIYATHYFYLKTGNKHQMCCNPYSRLHSSQFHAKSEQIFSVNSDFCNFAIMHGFNPNMDWFSLLSLFIAGLALGITYIYTKNLWFPIAYHFSWNFFQSLFDFNVSGQDFYSFIEFSIPTPNLFNGGAFGFEGSYLSLIADMVIVIGAIWIYQKKIKV